jgi:Ca2+/Na+ antiporter
MIAVGVILILPQIDRIIKIVVGVIMLVIYIGVIIFLIVVTKKFANRPIEDLADSSPKAEEQLSSQTEAREPSLDNTQNS